ncbi:TPA: hypothetical protein N0F65_006616 [Lagenidium giganteum]|uniref:Diphthine--ammonia ligase n=1 Tax=Lagenidium giganteum TaxID=4803 RepID=A0AAV2Z943_9STRA|nr:TPA: hypothetical protein N0F65_006616 [Lagenidium giganteum]
MKVVALVSGGKDSCYAMMECVRYGHEIVCLAHLHPPLDLTPEEAEIDSFMYQSVGHNVVSMIAEAMELQLVTDTITGKAITTDIDYHATIDGDEVEDLHRLLANVKRQFPDVQGVCSGAIFSSYQRNRVENVCSRLGLTSIGYLWRRDQEDLLNDMIESGMEAILVKVASFGLQPKKHLGRTLADLQDELLTLQEKYHLNVCGEGGEYETLTLDCPLFKKRIVIDASRVVLHSDDYYSPVAFLVIEQSHLEDKDENALPLSSVVLPSPARAGKNVSMRAITDVPLLAQQLAANVTETMASRVQCFRDQIYVSGLMSSKSAQLTLEEEMTDVLEQVKAALKQQQATLEDVCFVHLFVKDMSDFGRLNAAYCQHFPPTMPASRSCVEVAALPARVLIDCFALRGSGVAKLDKQRVQRDVMHIQSLSAWAPNCIGPYSQANVLHKALILLAGQISFFPQTMTLMGNDHTSQAIQCVKNAGYALEALASNLRHVCFATVYVSDTESLDAMALAATCRDQFTHNAGLKDVFDVEDSDESDEEVDKAAELVALVKHVPVLVVELSHLPRDALTEVELQALTHPVLKFLHPTSRQLTRAVPPGLKLEWQVTSISRAMCLMAGAISLDGALANSVEVVASMWHALLGEMAHEMARNSLPLNRVVHVRVFYVHTALPSEMLLVAGFQAAYQRHALAVLPAVTFVPVQAIQQHAVLAIHVTAHDLDKIETELWLRKQV